MKCKCNKYEDNRTVKFCKIVLDLDYISVFL